jgi:hypothetical protein
MILRLHDKPLKVRQKPRQTAAELRELQRLACAAIVRPLGPDDRMRRTWIDGRPMREVAAEFIKPNDRLTSLERLELYNRQYWFRVLDCLYDDYPGLRAILGEKKFHRLRVAYLAKYPSASFTLRNLGSRLEKFLTEEPQWTRPHNDICLDMVRFEWAQVVAFDEEAKPPMSVDDLLGRDPAKLRLALQPHVSLLDLRYPLDDFVLAVKEKEKSALRSEASNAMDGQHKQAKSRRVRLPRPQRTMLAVHRYDNELWYKRLDEPAYRLLVALRDGATLAEACDMAADGAAADSISRSIGEWFQTWAELGWFCKRTPR